MDRKAFVPEVISLTDIGAIGKKIKALGVPVRALGMQRGLPNPLMVLKLTKWLKQSKPDVIQTWLYHADLIGGLAAKMAGGIPVVWGVRTTELKKGSYITFAIRKLLAGLSCTIPSKIICVAEASRKKHIEIGYCARKMVVIGNGFNLNKLPLNHEQRRLLRYNYGFTEKHVVIGSVGRFSHDKGQDIFVQAAALLVKQFSNVRFLMVGRGLNKENTKLMEWLRAANLIEKFSLLGERHDIPDCLSVMDLFCLHSRTEGFPNALGEAMALGLPCVATDVGDVGVLMSDAGILVKRHNAQALTDGLTRFLGYSNQQQYTLGQIARKRIATEFTLANSCQKYKVLYTELLSRESR